MQYCLQMTPLASKDMEIRIRLAWQALNKMDKLWKSNIEKSLKIQFFRATVESVLLYGAKCWKLTKDMSNRLDNTYTRMLRAVLGVSWKVYKSNNELYGNLSKITSTFQVGRRKFIGHMWRRKVELVSQVLLWEPK